MYRPNFEKLQKNENGCQNKELPLKIVRIQNGCKMLLSILLFCTLNLDEKPQIGHGMYREIYIAWTANTKRQIMQRRSNQ